MKVSSRTFIRAVAVLGVVGVVGVVGACGEGRGGGFATTPDFGDGGTSEDPCPLHCSLDLRSVVRSCDGSVVDTCPPELGCAGGQCVPACQATATAQSSLGCEFYMQPPPVHPAWARSCYAAYVTNVWGVPTEIGLELEGRKLDLTGAIYKFTPGTSELTRSSNPVVAGDSVVVFLASAPPAGQEVDHIGCPNGVKPALEDWTVPARSGRSSSFHLTSEVPLSVATIYPFGGAASFVPSATLLLPVVSWGKQHVLIEPWERTLNSDRGLPGAQIVAAEDDTLVTVVPTKDIQGGPRVDPGLRGTKVTYTLSKGEFLQLSQDEELSGSIVESTRPTSIFGGHSCMLIPAGVLACDSAQQELPALSQWGSTYAAVRYRGRVDDQEPALHRVVAAFDGTTLTYDPARPDGAPQTLNAGEVMNFTSPQPFVVRSQDADHPFYLAAYMTSAKNPESGQKGDPEFVNVVPAGQYLNNYAFYADPTYADTSLVVIRQRDKAGFKDVWLECAGQNLDGWTPIGNGGEFEFRRVDLSRDGGPGETFGEKTCTFGLHRMKSDGAFTATLWGWAAYASYAYPGGMAQRNLATRPIIVR
jgi:IgGFc binding protein